MAISRPQISDENVQTGPAADHAGTQFFAVLNHEHGLVRQAADDAVGAVDVNQTPANLLQLAQELPTGMAGQFVILERGDDVLVGFKGQAQLLDCVVQDVGENLGIGIVPCSRARPGP